MAPLPVRYGFRAEAARAIVQNTTCASSLTFEARATATPNASVSATVKLPAQIIAARALEGGGKVYHMQLEERLVAMENAQRRRAKFAALMLH